MKVKYALVVSLVAVLALVLVAGPALGKTGSITGGGWFNNFFTENKITFGFNALPTRDGAEATAKGQFLLIDHGSKTRMRGTINSIGLAGPILSWFKGEVSIDGDAVSYTVNIYDFGEPGLGEGDKITIFIDGMVPTYHGDLGGGNLKRH